MTDAAPPLTWQTSDHSQPQQSAALPAEVVTCLENARFLHLATCTDNQPHVSLMNYTYLPTHQMSAPSSLPSGPTIIMTTNPSSRKTLNLVSNPSVSLLVHDWVSHRPPTNTRSISPDGRRNPARSSLATLLMGMNTSAMGSISATINGDAILLAQGSEEEKWCKRWHLENNTFEEHPMGAMLGNEGGNGAEDGGREAFVQDEDVRVVVVRIKEGRIADWKGGVKDWVLTPTVTQEGAQPQMVNGL